MGVALLFAMMLGLPRFVVAAPYDFPVAQTKPAPRRAPAAARHDTLIVFGHDSLANSLESDSLALADEPDSLTDQALAAADRSDTPGTRRTPPPGFKGFEAPRWVMLRSLVVPGWGQWHNGSWRKAIVMVGLEGWMISKVVADESSLASLDAGIAAARKRGDTNGETGLIAQFNARSDRSIAHQWWLGSLLAYSMLDAYIDAHFRNFRIDVDDDPALPPEQRRAAGFKLSWQERF